MSRPLAAVIFPENHGWMDEANCNGVDPDVMFPTMGSGRGGERTSPQVRDAKALCARCTVRAECLEYALSWPKTLDAFGIFGGTTPKERRLIRDARRRLQ